MAKVITTVLGKRRAAYRENEGGDMEKEELRRKLEEAEREIQRLQERRRENGFWTKKRRSRSGKKLRCSSPPPVTSRVFCFCTWILAGRNTRP